MANLHQAKYECKANLKACLMQTALDACNKIMFSKISYAKQFKLQLNLWDEKLISEQANSRSVGCVIASWLHGVRSIIQQV